MVHLIWVLLALDIIFCKLATKYVKINKENQISTRVLQLGAPSPYTHGGWQRGPAVNSAPCASETEQSTGLTIEKLIDGEVTGDAIGTHMFPILFRTYRYPQFARGITRGSSLASMAAQRWHALVLRASPATAWPGERGYSIYKP